MFCLYMYNTYNKLYIYIYIYTVYIYNHLMSVVSLKQLTIRNSSVVN